LTNFLDGALAGMLIVTDNVLSPDQITELYNGALRPTGISQSDIALDLRIIEGAGSLVKDYSTNSNDGTLIGGPTWIPNIPYGQQMHEAGHNVRLEGSDYINIAGTTDDATTDIEGNPITFYPYDADRFKLPTEAVQVFDGVDDYVSLANVSGLSSTDSFEIRFKLWSNDTSSLQAIFSQDAGLTNRFLIAIDSGSLIFVMGQTGSQELSVSINENQYYDVYFRYDNGFALCTVNGIVYTKTTIISQPYGGTATAAIARLSSTSLFFFDGYIDFIEVVGIGKWSEANGWVDEIFSNDGTLDGLPTSEIVALTYANHATPKTGVAVEFDGVAENITISNFDLSSIGSDSSAFCFWFNVDGAGGFETLFDIRPASDNRVTFYIDSSGGFRIFYNDISSDSTENGYDDGNWHLAIFGRNGSDLELWVDGTQLTLSVTDVRGESINANDLATFGTTTTSTLQFGGAIASVKIFSTSLNVDQIQQLYKDPQISLPTGVDASDLMLDLRLDDAATTTARDYSGNANDGTLSSDTMWLTGFEYPVKQLCLTNFNIGVNDELIFGLTDDATVDIDGNPISNPRLPTELNFPYTYHNGLVTSHRDSMNPTNGITLGFVTEYSLENTFDVIISKGDDITAANSIGVRTIGGDFQLIVNTDTLDLGYAPALTGTHSHIITVDISGNYKWYIDGVLVANGTINAAPANSESLYYGQDATDGREYAVPVGDYIFYNNVVDATEVLEIYNNQKLTYQ